MADSSSFKRFKQSQPTADTLTFEDGRYLAVVSCALTSWQWVVWWEGKTVGGRRSFHMGAYEACDEALQFIAVAKAGNP